MWSSEHLGLQRWSDARDASWTFCLFLPPVLLSHISSFLSPRSARLSPPLLPPTSPPRLTVCDWCREVALTLLTLLVHGGWGEGGVIYMSDWLPYRHSLMTTAPLESITGGSFFLSLSSPKLSPPSLLTPHVLNSSKSEARSSCCNYEGKAHLHTEK